MTEANRGRLLLLTAAILWSLSGIVVKSPALQAVPQVERGLMIACFRAMAAGCVFLPFTRFRNVKFRLGMIPMAVCFAVMNLTYICAMTRTTAGAAIVLQNTSLLWVFLFGVLFLKEPVRRGNLVAVLFGVVGLGVIAWDSWAGDYFVGNSLAVASGVAYAGVMLALRWLRDEDSAWLTALNHFVAGLALLPFVIERRIVPTPVQGTLIVLLGAIQMGLPYFLFARGLRTVPAQEAGLIAILEALLIPMWVWLLWGETLPPLTICGGLLIVTGLVARVASFRAD